MNKFALMGIAAAAATASMVAAAPAEAGTFSTYGVDEGRSTWETDLLGLTTEPILTETFEGLATGGGLGFSVTTDKLTASTQGVGSIVDLGAPAGNVFGATPVSTTFTLSEASLGFSVDLRQQSDLGTGTLSWTVFGESGDELGMGTLDVPDDGEFNFFGLISDDPTHLISSVEFQSVSGAVSLISYNDVAFAAPGAVESVPEPASMLGLLTVGAVAAGGALKRQRSAEA
jgi:hypothetical protein